MDVQNFRMLQNLKFKEQKLEEKLYKQKSILQRLRMEYESLKNDKEVNTTPVEKLKQKKNLRSIYTFKLPASKQKSDFEKPDRFRNGWIQRPLTELPHKIQELNMQRNRMIELGNSYSENNKNCPLTTKTIRNVKSQHEMKYEMLNRAKLLGNHYSFHFRQHHPLKVYKKSIDGYKKHERLINEKNEMEECFKSGEELPQIFPQKYLHVLNEIYRLEEELNLNHQFSDGNVCQEIFEIDSSSDQKLIDQLSYPIFDDFDVVSDKIEMSRAMERIDIGKILEARNKVEQRISEVFWRRDDVEEGTVKDLDWKVKTIENFDLIQAKVDSENSKVELKFDEVYQLSNDQIDTKSPEFTTDIQDVVIENKELIYINEKFSFKTKQFDIESEYLDSISNEFFTFKNLILEICDQASSRSNQSCQVPIASFSNSLEDLPSENQAINDKSPDTSITFTPIFSQNLDTKLAQTLKVFTENYIEDLCDISNIPKHHPSFEDMRIKYIHETTSNVDAGQENDDIQDISQVSHEICKSQSSILRTKSVESSKLLKLTNDAKINENFITYSSQKNETSSDYKSYNYSRDIALLSIENPQSAIKILYN
ncbi:hypothetical protein ACKWTF_005708 [Chironomus riparius]